MKTKISIIAILFLLMGSMNVSAVVWRVNNISGVDADFSTISAAISGAAAGDTLYIEGSPYSYGDVTLSKPLTFIGTGYFLSGYGNDSTQANAAASSIDLLTINSGASGSVFIGITADATPAYGNSTVTVNTSNISFIRCFFTGSCTYQTYSTYRSGAILRLSSGASNILISGCFIYQQYYYTSTCSSYCSWSVYALQMMGSNTGIVITNNIIKYGSKTTAAANVNSQYAFYMPTNSSAVITNNVIIGSFTAYNSTVANNVQIIGGVSGNYNTSGSYPNVTQNNIGHGTQFGTTGGNLSNVNMTSVFTYSPGNENTDNHYMLKTGSPAIGAGVQGEDCGAFGGPNTMIRSGMPGIPAIFEATVPATGTTNSGININIKAKAHK